MANKLVLKIFIGIVVLVLLSLIAIKVVVEPLILKKIQSAINDNNKDYNVKIGKVHLSVLSSELELENIAISSKPENNGIQDLNGEIESIRIVGIHLTKAIFKKNYQIREVIVFNSSIHGSIPFSKKPLPPKISSFNLRIDSLFLDKTNLKIKNTSTAQAYSMNDGVFKLYHLAVQKLDTLSLAMIKQFDFNVPEFAAISPDSMYTRTATGINYSATSNKLTVDSFYIRPNYAKSEFAARHKFEIDRIEAGLSHLLVHDFSVGDYLKSGSLKSSYIEIGKLNMDIFRDKRKEFRHVNRPAFQDMIYNYQGKLAIDSIGISGGNIIYGEHAEKASEPGVIRFNKLNALIFNITNDTIYKTEKAFIGFKAEAFLMGKGKMTVQMKGRLFDSQNTFAVNGKLSEIEVMELNPMLEKNAFIYATSGKIETMNFNFTANNTKSSGQMNLRYEGLNVAVKNKRTDDTTAVKERVISVIANMKIMDSNPMPGEQMRQGVIDFKRDPEKSFFNYCAKSLISGIKSSITKTPETRKESRRERRGKS